MLGCLVVCGRIAEWASLVVHLNIDVVNWAGPLVASRGGCSICGDVISLVLAIFSAVLECLCVHLAWARGAKSFVAVPNGVGGRFFVDDVGRFGL